MQYLGSKWLEPIADENDKLASEEPKEQDAQDDANTADEKENELAPKETDDPVVEVTEEETPKVTVLSVLWVQMRNSSRKMLQNSSIICNEFNNMLQIRDTFQISLQHWGNDATEEEEPVVEVTEVPPTETVLEFRAF